MDGRHVKAVLVIRRRSQEVGAGQGRGAQAIDPRPRVVTTNGGRAGDRLPENVIVDPQGNSNPLRDSDVGVLGLQVHSPRFC